MSVAGRPQADEVVPTHSDPPLGINPVPFRVQPLRSNPQLRQTTLFDFGTPSTSQNNLLVSQNTTNSDFQSPLNSIPWGDPLSFGGDVPDTTFRILSHNVNGLSTANSNTDVRDLARSLQEKSVSLFGLQETNRNFQKSALVESFHSIIRGVSSHHRGAVSSAKILWDSNYQPGGTAISVRNKWATRFLAQTSDDMGRWSTLTLTGKGTTKITFISAYRVCDGSSESQIATRTVRSQQEWMYNDRGMPAVDLRQQFLTDITRMMKSYQSKGHDIVLMMDANEASGHNSGVDRLCYDCSLVDAHSKAVTTISPPPTYQRGSTKIDFVLVSPRVAEAITSAAILALNDGYLSDHRALIVDFDAHILFGHTTSEVVAPTTRRLTSTNPIAVHTYVQHMLKHLEHHNLVEKVDLLQMRSESGTWAEADTAQWEVIDDLLVQGRAAAEEKCPSKRSGGLPWSPELEVAGKRLLYWKLRCREFTSCITNNDFLDSLAKSLQLSNDEVGWKTSQEVRALARKAKREHQKVKVNATERRLEHLAASAKLASQLHGMSEQAACAAIASREISSRQFKQLRRIFDGTKASGLEKIDVPNSFAVRRPGEPVPRIPLVVKEEIEDVLLPHTEQRFRQHQETPFGNGSRRSNLGLFCDSNDASAIRDGTYDRELEALSSEAREWLVQLQQRDYTKSVGGVIATNISCTDWVSGWSKMRESTASAPGGHYGHYKTASVAARLPDDHPDYTTKLAHMYATMWSLPLKHAFAPKRWSQCIDAIIEKIPGKPIIEKLRIIMLYEADFNFVLKLVWGRRLVRHAESHSSLGVSNHGSRPGRQTTDALLEKLLIYEHARLSRTSLITVDNDAKSCYDRIIKTLAMVSCIAVGLSPSAATMHNKTHHAMTHQIKSKHGLLRPYRGTDTDALEGVGQGSGSGPAIWLIYVASLLNAFRKFSPGINILSPYEQRIIHVLAVFFVDDGMPGVNDALDLTAQPLHSLLQQAHDASQSWERLLFASGGALELSKCFAYVLYWDLSGGEHRLIAPQEIPGCIQRDGNSWGPISLTYGNTSTVQHPLATEEPWVGRRTLGVRLAPAGTWNEEYSFRRSQSRDLALQLAGAAISHDTARVAYQSMVCPKLEFPLAVTQFTQKECDSITSPVLRTCLSKMGYNSNMPREVVYGPKSLGGIGMHDYYIEQGIHQLTALVGHVRQQSSTSAMMLSELHWCQVQAGTASHLLSAPAIPIDYIETCWIMSIRDFLCTYKMHINLTQSNIIPQRQCQYDDFIMDVLRNDGCSTRDLQRLNACRMHLRVARISDIAHPDGKSIRHEILYGSDNCFFRSASRWPRQGRPPKLWWNLWRRKLKEALSIDGSSPNLRHHLGPWYSHTLVHSEWDVLACTRDDTTTAYRRNTDGSYDVLQTGTIGAATRILVGASLTTTISLPDGCTPAHLGPPHKDGRRRIYFRPQCATNPTSVNGSSFSDYVATQPPHIASLLEHCDLSNLTARLMADRIYASATTLLDAGTDGGLLDDVGTFGFAWGISRSNSIIACGKGHIPGVPRQISSTRTELGGILAALSYFRLVREFFHIVTPRKAFSCTIFCDSKAALQRVRHLPLTSFGTTWRCRANYDIEAAISSCLSTLPLNVNWQWVKGHASRLKLNQVLTWAETLNEEADSLATLARTRTPNSLLEAPWPEQLISISTPAHCLRGNLSSDIRYCCSAPDIISYWKQRYSWSDNTVASIDIDSTRAVLSQLNPATARRIQKLRCGWLPVNSRESRIDPDRPPGCSACSPSNIIVEDVDHIFQCSSQNRRSLITSRFSEFSRDFRVFKTSRLIITVIQRCATAWVNGHDIPPVDTLQLPDSALGRLVSSAYSEQSSLGWGPFFRGFWSKSWGLAQEAQFQLNLSREPQDTGIRWSVKAQLWFVKLFESLWGLRNADEHGADPETQNLIRTAKCECAIRRLFDKATELPPEERHPFRSPIEDLLSRPTPDQELWITLTEAFLVKALPRARARGRNRQPAITSFFARVQ